MKTLRLVLPAAVLCFACRQPPPEGVYPCTIPADCPSNWSCHTDGRCWSHPETIDAAMPVADAGAPDTGPIADAGSCPARADAGIDGALGACVQCTDDSQCADFDAGARDAGADAGLAVGDGRAICDGNACVIGCRYDGQCRSDICRSNHRCSEYPRPGFDTQCLPCDDPSNCAVGSDCVETFFGGSSDGGHCLYPATGTTCPAPYTSVTGRSIVPGSSDMPYCSPSSITTCAAVLARGRLCTSTSDCPPRGSECGTIGPDGIPACTIDCRPAEATCPSPLICTGTGGRFSCVY